MRSLSQAGKKQFPINKERCLKGASEGGSVQQGFIRHALHGE
jgi:hypothetical protein